MEIFSTELKLNHNSFLRDDNGIHLCLASTRYFFDLPTKIRMIEEDKTYVLSVHDRKHRNGLKVKYEYGNIRIYKENHDKWVSRPYAFDTERKLITLFTKSRKKFLYVVIEEL